MGNVNHMKEHISLADFVQSALESFNQLGGKFTDETNGVAQEEGDVFYHNLPDRGVQSGEELVLCKHVRFCQQVHDGAFTHVGISNKGKTHQRASVAPLCCHLAVNLLQILLEFCYALLYNSAVYFNLGLTHTATGTHTAPLALQVGPHASQTR